ncbi:hypothetical protein BDZ45DRAFT_682098 [Acephala macrosclerotiorum]|nr:hypothetical protein BDZ45DRAFT_682098 [Acephala macrosclerotiorum]
MSDIQEAHENNTPTQDDSFSSSSSDSGDGGESGDPPDAGNNTHQRLSSRDILKSGLGDMERNRESRFGRKAFQIGIWQDIIEQHESILCPSLY